MLRYRTVVAALVTAIAVLAGCSRSGTTAARSSATPNGRTPVTYTDIIGTPSEKYVIGLAALGVFGAPGGTFNPSGTITRADFVKWLVLANNAIFANTPGKQIHLSQTATSDYPDVATSHPDFPYIQGMHDAGFAVGFPDKTFKPDALLTREEMTTIKESVDRGGAQPYYVVNWNSTMPAWKDRDQINPIFRGAIAEDSRLDSSAVSNWNQPEMVIGNVPRAFGAVAAFRPQDTVTRGQAAAALWKIGPHNDDITIPEPGNLPRSATDALRKHGSTTR